MGTATKNNQISLFESLKMSNRLSRLLVGSAIALLTLSAWAEQDVNDPIGHFEIVRFEVDGNTLLGAPAIDRLLAPYAGKNRDFGDVQRALEALEAAYRQHGFNVVQVVLPEQELNHGVVHLTVVEVRVGTVTVEGNKFFETDNIRRSVPGIHEGQSPNIDNTSASLKLANENPAKKTTLQLQSGGKDGEVDAVLHVIDEKPWSVGLNLDNTGDEATGHTHVGLLYQNANMFGLDHILSLQYTTTAEHPSQVSVYGAGYHVPLYAYGDSLDFFASYSDVNAGTVAAGIFDLQVSGKGSVYGVRYNQNMKRIGDYESKLIYGLDYKAFKNDVQLVQITGFQLGSDVTVHPLMVGYAGTRTLPMAEFGYYLNASHNLPGGDHGGSDDFTRARSGASASYNILRYGANYGRVLPGDWRLRANVNGQITSDALVPGEQFGVGGATSVRGFNEREVANDSGFMGSVELYTPNLCAGVGSSAMQCRTLAFYDAANVSRNKALPGEQTSASIASVGLGLRVNVDKVFSMQMDYGQVIDASDTRAKGERRLHVKASLSY